MAPKTPKLPAWDDTLTEAVIEEAISHLDADEKFQGTSDFSLKHLMPLIRKFLCKKPYVALGKKKFGIFGQLESGQSKYKVLREVAPNGLFVLMQRDSATWQRATSSGIEQPKSAIVRPLFKTLGLMAEQRESPRQTDEQSPSQDEAPTQTDHPFDDASNIRGKTRKWRGLLEEMINDIDAMPASGGLPPI